MTITDCLRDFWINNLVTVLAISLLDDVFDHIKGDRDDFFLISHPHILQFFELPTAVRALFELEDNDRVHSIRSLA